MIKLTRFNDSLLVVNTEIIEFIESNPDTIVSLTTGHKILVKESMEEVIEKVKDYKRSIFHGPLSGD